MEKKVSCLILQQFLRDEYLFTLEFNKALYSSKKRPDVPFAKHGTQVDPTLYHQVMWYTSLQVCIFSSNLKEQAFLVYTRR